MRGGLEPLESSDAQSCTFFRHPPAGLRAILVIDNTALGPAAGGIRTWRYPSSKDALVDAFALARAMSLKCALAGLDAGGGKMVVLDDTKLDRSPAFEWLGRRVEELGGSFRTAGDLGTHAEDLQAMARTTRYVHQDEGDLTGAVGETVHRSMEACAGLHGHGSLAGLSVAIQGCGNIGAAVAHRLAIAKVRLVFADSDEDKARHLAAKLGGECVPPDAILSAHVDILSPCAKGGVLDRTTAQRVSAWAVCGGANNILATDDVEDALRARQITFVPDVLSSSGAVIAGIARTVMNVPDVTPLLARVGDTATEVLKLARERNLRATAVALELASARIAAASPGTRRRSAPP